MLLPVSLKKNLDNIKLKKVSIFIQGGISGIDDKELKYIFILRPGLNSNDTNNEKDKQNISVGIVQIIGRIRERGGYVYITREDEIDLNKYLQESYNRILSDKTKNNYSFFKGKNCKRLWLTSFSIRYIFFTLYNANRCFILVTGVCNINSFK